MATTVLGTLSTAQSLIAGLGGNYVVTQDGSGNPSGTLNLRSTASLSTVASSVTLTSTFPDESCCNNNGDAYLLTTPGSGTTVTLRSLTQSAGTLSMTTIGTFTMAAGGTSLRDSFLDPADTQVLVRYNGTSALSAVDTATGALDWTATLTGHTVVPRAMMGNDRFLVTCTTHNAIELWNGTGPTLLDSLTRDPDLEYSERLVPLTATSCFYAIGVVSTATVRYGLLSTSGDVLSWTWGPLDYATAWAASSDVLAAAWGTTVAIGPRLAEVGSPARPLYVIDGDTGRVTVSDTDTSVGKGVYEGEFFWAGASSFAYHDTAGYNLITAWSYVPATAPTYLRQRQSPLATPSRVRGVDLRQRQTTRITRP